MKKIIILLFLAVISIYSHAQQQIDGLKLIDDVCKTKLSPALFENKYKNNIQKDEEEDDDQVGMYNLKGLSLANYPSSGIVIISPELNWRIVAVGPDYENLDSISRYQAAEKCHDHMIAKLGEPDGIEDAKFDNPMLQEIVGTMNVTGGKNYIWTDKDDISYIAMWLNTDKEDTYTVMVLMTPSPYSTTTPIQRKFFKSLEFGKYAAKQQISSALQVLSIEIQEERKSSGKSYTYWDPIYFGGIEWSFVEFNTVEGELSEVIFTHTKTKNNQDIFDSLFEALKQKYGDPKILDNEAFWSDGKTSILLSYLYGESKGGEMRHYVKLEYGDMQLLDEAQNIIANEL